ncbi:hypothetical protein Mgra_00006567 [Meloidogyne graminicola]|uniref:Store-operated calcium entry-associated regulatory factor n=1 Tax=Meloidogyne graminicola TaxID=189291 RepID=A0A8S9ZL72_9BILA|nr:hypothetical protein Mgra_00006567 [Meloidogyne graminicola]
MIQLFQIDYLRIMIHIKLILNFIVFIIILGLGEARQKILLSSISVLTLYRGSYTEGSKPIPQLECIGGTASGRHSPKVVQCYNKGSDGRDVQWECKAELPVEYQFGRIEVSCEGFDYRDDPYVVAGSCGLRQGYFITQTFLRYELDYSKYGVKEGTYLFNFEKIVSFLVILFIIYLVYLMFTSSGSSSTRGTGRGSGSWWGPDDRRPPPPGWNPPPPPSYDDSTNQNYYHNKGPSSSSGGPGFFSGLGLGALGGYLFGSSGNYNSYGYDGYGSRYRGRSNYFGGSSPGYSGTGGYSSSSSSSGGSTHTSSGFGGTSRR